MANNKLNEVTLCSIDLETSGGYPLDSEICEIAAVKWRDGKIIDTYQTLIKPDKVMSDFIITIHGITNEMVANSPKIQDKISELHAFIKDTVVVAHHAPFDVGFLSIEMEKKGLLAPQSQVLCTSLLAQTLFPESVNHKLQTLVQFFNFEKNQAHRAYDDAISCQNVVLKCIEKMGWDKTVDEAIKIQGKTMLWQNFYMNELKKNPNYNNLIIAIQKQQKVRVIYKQGNAKSDEIIQPHGLVRSPDGDYIFAFSEKEKKVRRYYLGRIAESEIVLDPQLDMLK